MTATQDNRSVRSDAELLALFIRSGNWHQMPPSLWHSGCCRRFGGLRQLLQADPSVTCRGAGHRRVQVSHYRERCRSSPGGTSKQSLPAGDAIRSPDDTRAFLQAKLRHLGHELFCCLYLDNRHRVLRFDEMFRGTIDGTSVYPREVVKEALSSMRPPSSWPTTTHPAWPSPARPTNASPSA